MFCRMCGEQLEGDEGFCPQCGAKVLTVQPRLENDVVKEEKKIPALKVLVIVLAILSIGLAVFGYMKNRDLIEAIASKDATISDLNTQVDELNTQIDGLNKEIKGYKQDIADRIEGLNRLKNEKLKSDYKAQQYDSIIAFAGTDGIGPESGSFCAEKSFIILKTSDPARKVKITTKLNGQSTIDMSVNGSAAKAQWDETSWSTSTTITVTPCSAGVSTIKFSNNINSNVIKIVVIVV